MKKIMISIFIMLNMIFTACDNNSGPFGHTYVDDELIITSAGKPAKGWVKTQYKASNNPQDIYAMELDQGLPTGNIIVYDNYAEPFFEMEAKEVEKTQKIKGYHTYSGKVTLNGVVVDGDFRIVLEDFLAVLDEYITGRATVYILEEYFFNGIIVNGVYKTEKTKLVYKNRKLVEKWEYGKLFTTEEYYSENGEKTGVWKTTFNGSNTEVKPGTVIKETKYKEDSSSETKEYNFKRKAFDYRFERYDENNEPMLLTYDGDNNGTAFGEGGVGIEVKSKALKLRIIYYKDIDNVCRIGYLEMRIPDDNGILSIYIPSLSDPEFQELLKALHLDQLYPEYKFDNTRFYKNITLDTATL